MLGVHRKVLRRQLEEAILIDWAQERGVIKYRGCVYKVNKRILNSKIEHWRPRPVFIVGRQHPCQAHGEITSLVYIYIYLSTQLLKTAAAPWCRVLWSRIAPGRLVFYCIVIMIMILLRAFTIQICQHIKLFMYIFTCSVSGPFLKYQGKILNTKYLMIMIMMIVWRQYLQEVFFLFLGSCKSISL